MVQRRFFGPAYIDRQGAALAGTGMVASVPDRETEFKCNGTVHGERDPDEPDGPTKYGIHCGMNMPNPTEAEVVDIHHETQWNEGFVATRCQAFWRCRCSTRPSTRASRRQGSGCKRRWASRRGTLLRTALAIQDLRAAELNGKPLRDFFLVSWLNRMNLTR